MLEKWIIYSFENIKRLEIFHQLKNRIDLSYILCLLSNLLVKIYVKCTKPYSSYALLSNPTAFYNLEGTK